MYIPKRDAEGNPIQKNTAFSDAGNFRARFEGISGTAAAGTTTDIDHLISEERYINGIRLIISDHIDGDKIDFQVIDKDNILGFGANTVLDEFGKNWFVDPGVCTQPDVVVPYPAKIMAGLYIRVKYHSTGASPVNIKANMYLHWKSE